MPFTPYRHVLSPDDLPVAQEAFDLAWAVIATAEPHDTELARQLLAKRIVQAIRDRDERYPQRLMAIALDGFKP